MTRLLAILIISLLSICCGLILRAQDAPPPLPPVQRAVISKPILLSPRQAAGRSVFFAVPNVTNRLTVEWDSAPFAEKYKIYVGTNENDLSWDYAETTNTRHTLTYVNPWRQRPPRWFFGIATVVDSVRESETVFAHWPPYQQILTGVRLSWSEATHVTLETSTDQIHWTAAATVDGNQVEFPLDGPTRFYRDAAGVLALTIEPVFSPDPRDVQPAEIDDF